MKALVLNQLHQPLTVQDVPDPIPKHDEIIVRLVTAALNHRDVWISKGQYPGIRLPVIPGSDGAGEVNGKPVIINPNIGWGENEAVQDNGYHILGLPSQGTFAAQVAVQRDRIMPKPTHLSWAEAAALPLAGLTAWRALFSRGRLAEGEKVLISGVGGGVALFAFQFAVAAGAEVWVTSGSDEKINKAKHMGARGGVNYTTPEWSKDLKKMVGLFDLIIDSAGGDGFSQLIDLAAPAGRIAFYGGTKGEMTLNPQKIFWKQLDILGTTMGSDKDFEDMVRFVNHHQIKPVVDGTYPLEQGWNAFQRMEAGLQFGKIVLQIQEPLI